MRGTLQVLDVLSNKVDHIGRGRGATHVARVKSLRVDHLIDRAAQHVAVVVEAEMVQKIGAGVQHGQRVGHVLSRDALSCVSCALSKEGHLFRSLNCSFSSTTTHGLKDGKLVSVIGTRRDAGTADQATRDVGQDVAIQVGQQKDVKLVRITHHLCVRKEKRHSKRIRQTLNLDYQLVEEMD